MKINRHFILASASPRRKELLENLGLDFQIIPSDFPEITNPDSPQQTAIYNATGKAKDIAQQHPESLVLGVDTVVAYQHHILGKPQDREDAYRILKLLSNTTHQVISAIHLIDGQTGKEITKTSTTEVTIDPLTEEQIQAYLNSGEGVDKAAGYAIQGLGALFISEIAGDYFNVVGLPIHTLHQSFQELGLEILL